MVMMSVEDNRGDLAIMIMAIEDEWGDYNKGE